MPVEAIICFVVGALVPSSLRLESTHSVVFLDCNPGFLLQIISSGSSCSCGFLQCCSSDKSIAGDTNEQSTPFLHAHHLFLLLLFLPSLSLFPTNEQGTPFLLFSFFLFLRCCPFLLTATTPLQKNMNEQSTQSANGRVALALLPCLPSCFLLVSWTYGQCRQGIQIPNAQRQSQALKQTRTRGSFRRRRRRRRRLLLLRSCSHFALLGASNAYKRERIQRQSKACSCTSFFSWVSPSSSSFFLSSFFIFFLSSFFL